MLFPLLHTLAHLGPIPCSFFTLALFHALVLPNYGSTHWFNSLVEYFGSITTLFLSATPFFKTMFQHSFQFFVAFAYVYVSDNGVLHVPH